MKDDPNIRSLVLRIPVPLLERIDTLTAERGGSRTSAMLHLFEVGLAGDAGRKRDAEHLRARTATKLRNFAEALDGA